jgi:hypothetical protein
MLFKILNPIKLFKFLNLFLLYNFKFFRNEYLNRKFYNLELLVKNLFVFEKKDYSKYHTSEVPEHQIGRIINMRNLFRDYKNEITGDLLELGVFEGMSLVFFDKFLPKDKKIIGIDTFEGLPHESVKVSLGERSVETWVKGEFGNTSILKVQESLEKFKCRKITLIKGVFSDPDVKEKLNQATNHISVVHIDCDLRDSAYDALNLLKNYLDKKKAIFILFDDWGVHQNEIPDGYYKWVNDNQKIYNFKYETVFTTNMTRYIKLTF